MLAPLILAGHVVLSAVVKLELLAGVRKNEARTLEDLLSGLRGPGDFPSTESCNALLKRARGRGLLGGIPDLMILADCKRTGSSLMSLDAKLLKLANELKVPTLAV